MAGVVDCRVANSDHMAEEERQDHANLRARTDLQSRHDIAVTILRFELLRAASGVHPDDKDPEQYVENNS